MQSTEYVNVHVFYTVETIQLMKDITETFKTVKVNGPGLVKMAKDMLDLLSEPTPLEAATSKRGTSTKFEDRKYRKKIATFSDYKTKIEHLKQEFDDFEELVNDLGGLPGTKYKSYRTITKKNVGEVKIMAGLKKLVEFIERGLKKGPGEESRFDKYYETNNIVKHEKRALRGIIEGQNDHDACGGMMTPLETVFRKVVFQLETHGGGAHARRAKMLSTVENEEHMNSLALQLITFYMEYTIEGAKKHLPGLFDDQKSTEPGAEYAGGFKVCNNMYVAGKAARASEIKMARNDGKASKALWYDATGAWGEVPGGIAVENDAKWLHSAGFRISSKGNYVGEELYQEATAVAIQKKLKEFKETRRRGFTNLKELEGLIKENQLGWNNMCEEMVEFMTGQAPPDDEDTKLQGCFEHWTFASLKEGFELLAKDTTAKATPPVSYFGDVFPSVYAVKWTE